MVSSSITKGDHYANLIGIGFPPRALPVVVGPHGGQPRADHCLAGRAVEADEEIRRIARWFMGA